MERSYVNGGISSKPWLTATVECTSRHTKRPGTAMENPEKRADNCRSRYQLTTHDAGFVLFCPFIQEKVTLSKIQAQLPVHDFQFYDAMTYVFLVI